MPLTLRRAALGLLALPALLLSLAGCDGPPEPRVSADTHGPLAYVPPDTPYVYGNLRPVPEAFVDKMFRIYGDMGEVYVAGLEHARQTYELLLEQARAQGRKVPAEPPRALWSDSGLMQLWDAIAAELAGRMSPEGLRELGFRTDARAVFYGLGLYPVVRIELADGEKVRALLRRIEANSGQQGDWRRFEGAEYLRIDGEQTVLLLGTRGDQLIAGLLPEALEERYLAHLFGELRPPAGPITAVTLTGLVETYGFTGYGEGYVDLQRIAGLLTGRGEMAAEAAGAIEMPRPSPACARLVESLVAGAPRMVMGVTRLDDRAIGMQSVVETSPAVNDMLQGLTEPVPGLGRPSEARFSFGTGINVPGLRGALRALGNHLLARGEGCTWVDPAAVRRQMSQLELALGPMTAIFKGVLFEALELELDPETLQPDLGSLRARALVKVTDPGGVFALIGLFNPQLARLEVPRDGTPVQVPPQQLPPAAPDLHVAIRGDSLVLASGEGGAGLIEELLASPLPERPPLLTMSYDMQGLEPLVRAGLEQQVALLQAEGAEPALVEATRRQGAAALRMYEHYGQTRLSVRVAEHGLVFDSETELR